MKQNEGTIDRALRVIVGIAVIGAGIYFEHRWMIIVGIVPLLTGLVGICPAYLPFHLSTKKD